jgi:putative tricarboxylic transport membrane protein
MKAEKIASLTFTVLSIAYIAGAFMIKEPPLRQQLGPEAFPFAIGTFMLVLSLIYVYRQFRAAPQKSSQDEEVRAAIIGADEKVEGKIDYKVVGIMLALMLFYALTFELLGFPLVTFIVFVAGVFVLDRNHLKRDTLIALIASFGIFMLFRFVLRVNLPAGVLAFLFR